MLMGLMWLMGAVIGLGVGYALGTFYSVENYIKEQERRKALMTVPTEQYRCPTHGDRCKWDGNSHHILRRNYKEVNVQSDNQTA